MTPFAPTRLLSPLQRREPNPDCPVCGSYQAVVVVDLSRATLNDLIEDFVRLELGYGDREFVVNNEAMILYDVDETENLDKKLSELGMEICLLDQLMQVDHELMARQESHLAASLPSLTTMTKIRLSTSSSTSKQGMLGTSLSKSLLFEARLANTYIDPSPQVVSPAGVSVRT